MDREQRTLDSTFIWLRCTALIWAALSVGCGNLAVAPERSHLVETEVSAPRTPADNRRGGPTDLIPEWLNPFNRSDRLASEARRLEKGLQSRREKEQYFRHQSELKDDQERIELLRLPTFEDRQAWLEARGHTEPTGFRPDVEQLIEQNDIALGMTRRAVRESWGEPELIEVAGNPIYGNERWHFSDQSPTPDGFQTERRTVYFDRGLVVGWERR